MKRIELMVDSGAYSAFKLGGKVHLGHYIEFVKRNQDLIAHHISLDRIPYRGNEREFAEISYNQHQVMKREGLSSIPVLHQNEDLDWLRRYLDDGEPMIALGTRSKGRHANPWFDRCFRVLRDYPEVKVHGLGMSTPMALHRYRNRWTSVDSRTWLKQSSVHQIPCPVFRDDKPNYRYAYDTIGLGEQRAEKRYHVTNLGPSDRARLDRYLAECGVTIEECKNDVYDRQRVWIRYFNALAAHTNVNIFLVSDPGTITRDHLTANGAHRHLLSYYVLRNARSLKPYVTGVR